MMKRKQTFDDIDSLLSQGVQITGNVNSVGSMRIDGQVEGKLDIKGDLVIGEQGRVKGEVRAKNLKLAGRIEGNAIAAERFDLTSTGIMMGDIQCTILTIDEGGTLEGTTHMGQSREMSKSTKNTLSEKTVKA